MELENPCYWKGPPLPLSSRSEEAFSPSFEISESSAEKFSATAASGVYTSYATSHAISSARERVEEVFLFGYTW